MSDDVDDKDKVDRANARQNAWIAKEVEASDAREGEEQMHDMKAPKSEERRDEEEREPEGDENMEENEPNGEPEETATMSPWGRLTTA